MYPSLPVVVVWRGDHHGIEVGVFEQLAEVGVFLRGLFLIGKGDDLRDVGQAELGDVADRHDVVLELEDFADERLAAVPATDEGDVELLVRVRGLNRWKSDGDGPDGRGGVQERPARRRLGHGGTPGEMEDPDILLEVEDGVK